MKKEITESEFKEYQELKKIFEDIKPKLLEEIKNPPTIAIPVEQQVIKESDSQRTVLLAEIIDHIHYCPIGFNENSMIVSKSWSGKDLLEWLKKLHQLSKQSL